MSTRKAPRTRPSDMASVVKEKAPNLTAQTKTIGPWTPPSADERARAADYLTRRGAGDLVEILGLVPPAPTTGPLARTCPTCAAPAGVRCHTTAVRSRLAEGHHRARLEAA